MTDERKQKKAAQALQALLELDGIKATVKDISGKIEGESLVDLIKLKDKLANDMRDVQQNVSDTASSRRNTVGDYIVANWDSLKDNTVVKDALLNSYCMGRYTRDQRDVMAQELLDKVGAKIEKKVAVVKPVKTKVAKVEVAKAKVEAETIAVEPVAIDESSTDHRQYTF